MGAKVKSLTTLGERSATGMGDIRGVLVLEVPAGSGASKFLQSNDVILSFNLKKINTLNDLLQAHAAARGRIRRCLFSEIRKN
jgi:S1-C subfamily serine protease